VAKLITNNYQKQLSASIRETIRIDVSRFLKDHFADTLSSNVDEDGNRFPEKTESTKKSYSKNNWDTEHWLVRTGESTKIKAKINSDGITVSPAGKEILKKIKGAAGWFTLSDQTKNKIMEIIRRKLKS
jgi:hypothetical protein